MYNYCDINGGNCIHTGLEIYSIGDLYLVPICLWVYFYALTIAIGVIAESLSRSPFSIERPAPSGQWKCKLKGTISIAVAQRLRYIVSYRILSHSHSISIAFVLHCISLYGTTLYDKL